MLGFRGGFVHAARRDARPPTLIHAIGLVIRQSVCMEPLLEIIHEDPELLAINKPADLVCHPSKNGPMSSLIGRVRLYLGAEARPHLVNRLDRETSGVTLVAKTD